MSPKPLSFLSVLRITSVAQQGSRLALRHPLRRTLERTPALAALVEELVIDTELRSQDPAETRGHQRVVAACLNVPHLTVLGYASSSKGDVDVVGKYREAIAGRTKLETFHVSECAGMWTFAQLLDMLRGWPQLEKLILKDTLLPADASSIYSSSPLSTPPTPTPTPPQGPCCTRLKIVKITDNLDASMQFSLAAFATIAPSAAVLWIEPRPENAPPTSSTACARGRRPSRRCVRWRMRSGRAIPRDPPPQSTTSAPLPRPIRPRSRTSPHMHHASAIPALLRATPPSLTLRIPPPGAPRTCGDACGAAGRPNLRALAGSGPALPTRVHVGKGEGRSLRKCKGGRGGGDRVRGVPAPAVVQALKNGASSFLLSLFRFSCESAPARRPIPRGARADTDSSSHLYLPASTPTQLGRLSANRIRSCAHFTPRRCAAPC
ncbi:hypothetical protein B0H11DRAFT_2416277 [Mycena galericulata]|nr:hypothetical protein B0H11DRAFT_2416277 [Mycena galericulata]